MATESSKQERMPIELRFWHHCLIFLLAYLILIWRRPDAIFNAQFCAEDGFV
jgi:hypothetical protein